MIIDGALNFIRAAMVTSFFFLPQKKDSTVPMYDYRWRAEFYPCRHGNQLFLFCLQKKDSTVPHMVFIELFHSLPYCSWTVAFEPLKTVHEAYTLSIVYLQISHTPQCSP